MEVLPTVYLKPDGSRGDDPVAGRRLAVWPYSDVHGTQYLDERAVMRSDAGVSIGRPDHYCMFEE